MRVSYEDMCKEFARILISKGFTKERAEESAKMFADTSLDGVYSHGYIRFPRVIEYIEKGYIDVNAVPKTISAFQAVERLDGCRGMGNLNAKSAMERAVSLAGRFGIGLVAMSNTNHWMRGGTYGWQAADAGCIGICWTNTSANMPAWGSLDNRIGNNPFILAIPRENGSHVVVDMAMAQYSYGKLETTRLNGEQLPYPGGFDKEGHLTCDPGAIEETKRVLPIGYWKGSGMSIALDLIANAITLGNTVTMIRKNCESEYGLSQVFIAVDPCCFGLKREEMDALIDVTLEDIKESEASDTGSKIRYPGEGTIRRRNENMKNGIPVKDEIWKEICNMG